VASSWHLPRHCASIANAYDMVLTLCRYENIPGLRSCAVVARFVNITCTVKNSLQNLPPGSDCDENIPGQHGNRGTTSKCWASL
jgi:hypothetical protein